MTVESKPFSISQLYNTLNLLEMKLNLIRLSLLSAFMVLEIAADSPSYEVLKFGPTTRDYIKFKPNMEPFASALSVCSWIQKFLSGDEKSGSLTQQAITLTTK